MDNPVFNPRGIDNSPILSYETRTAIAEALRDAHTLLQLVLNGTPPIQLHNSIVTTIGNIDCATWLMNMERKGANALLSTYKCKGKE